MSLAILLLVFLVCDAMGCCNLRKWDLQNYFVYCVLGAGLIIAATFRPSFMPDYHQYIDNIMGGAGASRLEPAFRIITFVCGLFGVNPLGSLFVYALCGTSLMMYCIKRDSSYPWFSLMLFVSIYFILGEMIQIRQAVAIGFLLMSVKYIYEKDKGKFWLAFFGGICFHYSALAILPLYYLSPTKINKKAFLIALGICAVVGQVINYGYIVKLLNIGLISTLYYIKTANIDVSAIPPVYLNIRMLIQVAICVFFWIYSDAISGFNKYALLYLKIYTIGLSIFLLFYSLPDLADRLSTMFIVAEIMLIPLAIRIIKPEWVSKGVVMVIGLKYFSTSIVTYLLN